MKVVKVIFTQCLSLLLHGVNISHEGQPMTAKTAKEWMADRGWTVDQLADRATLDKKVTQQIVAGQWTPSPQQRARIAKALDVEVDEIRWEHRTPVEHMYGHGPQFGRSP